MATVVVVFAGSEFWREARVFLQADDDGQLTRERGPCARTDRDLKKEETALLWKVTRGRCRKQKNKQQARPAALLRSGQAETTDNRRVCRKAAVLPRKAFVCWPDSGCLLDGG
jgi:hypothetical protein